MKIGFVNKKEDNMKGLFEKKLSGKEIIMFSVMIIIIIIGWKTCFNDQLIEKPKELTEVQKQKIKDIEKIIINTRKYGLVKFIKPDKMSVYVNYDLWKVTSVNNKKNFGSLMAEYMKLKFKKSPNVWIRNYLNGEKVSFYSN